MISPDARFEAPAAIEARGKVAVTAMAQRYDSIGDVWGRGVLLGVELVEDRETRKPANEMCREAVRQCEAKSLAGTGARQSRQNKRDPAGAADGVH
jgi:4-aminobutyrate aminotransferase-like enzyme